MRSIYFCHLWNHCSLFYLIHLLTRFEISLYPEASRSSEIPFVSLQSGLRPQWRIKYIETSLPYLPLYWWQRPIATSPHVTAQTFSTGNPSISFATPSLVKSSELLLTEKPLNSPVCIPIQPYPLCFTRWSMEGREKDTKKAFPGQEQVTKSLTFLCTFSLPSSLYAFVLQMPSLLPRDKCSR